MASADAEQEAFAVESHKKAAAAQAAGKLEAEIVAIKGPTGLITKDGCIRPETTAESLAGLKPAFDEKGTVTAGTSSPLTDGASATLVCTEEYAKTHGLEILARIKSVAVAGCDPEIMGIGPVAATKKALARAGLKIGDIDIIELNEAFSSQSLGCVRDLDIDLTKVNLDGGAIALLVNPLGAHRRPHHRQGGLAVEARGQAVSRSRRNASAAVRGIATILEAV